MMKDAELPPAPKPAGTYLGHVQVGQLLFVSGHGPVAEGKAMFQGKLGRDFDIEQGRCAAELAVQNLLATVKAEIGDLSRIRRAVKLLVFVNSVPDFTKHPLVADGASDVLLALLGPKRGGHARSAVGVASLPFCIAVEVEGVFELEDDEKSASPIDTGTS